MPADVASPCSRALWITSGGPHRNLTKGQLTVQDHGHTGQEKTMFLHPEISSQLASERRSDMLTSARNQRLARQLRTRSGTAQQSTRRPRRPLRVVGRLFTAFQP